MNNLKSLLINLFLLFILFQTLNTSLFNLPSIYTYWDEGLTIILLFISFLIILKKKKINKEYFKLVIILSSTILIGILGNIVNQYCSSINFIFRDIVNYIKFPFMLIALKITKLDEYLARSCGKSFFNILKGVTIILLGFGLVNLFFNCGMSYGEIRYGIRPYTFLFSHPTFLVLSCVFMIVLFESNNTEKKYNVYQIFLIIVIFLTMRTKGIVFCGIFLFIKYFGKMFMRFKIIYWIIIIVIAYYSAISKVETYLSYSTSAREVIYTGSIQLAKEKFPVGSGFSTFASRISWKANSGVYDFIIIPVWAYENCNPLNVLGDTGYPYYIGQLGIIGFFLFGLFMYKYYKISKFESYKELPFILLGIYILIALTSESILVNNGVEVAIVLSIIQKIGGKNEEKNDEKNRNSV